jgi:spermidine/putrescine transport system ATP-binding protein
VTDASFIGVSTQYLVRAAWGQELVVFAQNVGTGVLASGTPVSLHWEPGHTFALDLNGSAPVGSVGEVPVPTAGTAAGNGS